MKTFLSPLLAIMIVAGTIGTNAQSAVRNDSVISAAMELMSIDSITGHVQWLQDMGTRFLMKPNRRAVAEAIKARFESYGMTEVRLDSFLCYTSFNYGIHNYDTTTWQYNVEAVIPGFIYPEQEIILLGHYDDMAETSGPMDFAPGADDNASGTAAVLETARVLMLMGYQPEKTLVFLATAAEELMYFGDGGAEHYAAEAAASGRSFDMVLNNDMIAYNDGTSTIWISNIIGFEEVTDIVSLVAYEYCDLNIHVSEPIPYFGADLHPFENQGWPGVGIMEMGFNPNYHTVDDIVENCDMEYLTEVIRISCGSMIYGDISVGTEEIIAGSAGINLYPNPCRDNFRLSCPVNDLYEVLLRSSNGQLILSGSMNGKDGMIISMEGLAPGVYFVTLTGRDRVLTKKIHKR